MSQDLHQAPEQVARHRIDARLRACGWQVQDKQMLDFNAGLGIAVREYHTDIGPADYLLFVDRQPLGVVEAKPDAWGARLTLVEEQSAGYANARLQWLTPTAPLPFVYESTGAITRFTDRRDPSPRSREVFSFHRPETLKAWAQAATSLRAGIAALSALNPDGLRDCQTLAITGLETSLKADKPRALVQMATGSGKSFTAITQVYRLLKHAGARRILFLVDTKNLGEQAEQEFMAFIPNDDNRKFTELYNVQRLTSPAIANDNQVVISTIQRLYATLKGEPLAEGAEDDNPAEQTWRRKEPLPVVYNAGLPPEFFDVVVIDECHRSIYNLWRQVIEYFDAYLIGLTATPDSRTYGFFQKNVVSEYTHEQAVADKVNVGNEKMKGRGTRVLQPDDLKKVSPSAQAKTHYVIVDAVGVTRSLKTASRPLDSKPSIPFKDLAMGLMLGDRAEETVSSLAARLSRLDQQLEPEAQQKIASEAGKPLTAIVRDLFDAIDPDQVEADIDAALTRADALRQSILKKPSPANSSPKTPTTNLPRCCWTGSRRAAPHTRNIAERESPLHEQQERSACGANRVELSTKDAAKRLADCLCLCQEFGR